VPLRGVALSFVRVAIGALLAVLTVGCGPIPTLEDRLRDDTIVTRYDPEADFATYATFALPDAIPLVVEGPPADVEAEYAAVLLARIGSNLERRGYARVARGEAPDLAVNVGLVLDQRVLAREGRTGRYGSWWGAGGYYGSGYWGYPGYGYAAPWFADVLLYSTSTLVMELVDLRAERTFAARGEAAAAGEAGEAGEAREGGERRHLRVVWAALIYGALRSSNARELAQTEGSIDEAFAQSPYLTRLTDDRGDDGR
jgi:hypothetical protein